MCQERHTGTVTLVGAGPGAADLLTVRAHRLLSTAGVVAYDELVSEEIRALFPKEAVAFPVGRRAKGIRYHDERIHPEILRLALLGHDVVRLKGGDPMLFGRGGEEIDALDEAGIPWEVVPGITAALGAAAALGLPLTQRELATHVTFATAHFSGDDGEERARAVVTGLPTDGTAVLYMGLASLDRLSDAFVSNGRSTSTPVVVVSRATLGDQRVVRGTLEDIGARVREAALVPPALVVIGEVARERLPQLVPPPLESATRIRSGEESERGQRLGGP